MTKVILVRHGLTLWNHELRYQGHADIPLTEEGYQQAEKVAQRLAKEKIDAVYASDLGRAANTAKAIADKHGLLVGLLPDMREIHFGQWEGKTYVELQQLFPELVKDWFAQPADLAIPEGETFRQVKERAYGALLRLAQEHKGQTIVVASHGGTIRAVLCAVLDIDLNKLWQIKQDNTAVSILEFYDTKAMVALVNDTHHLRGDVE
jgi:alpha-ribazole phosphatase